MRVTGAELGLVDGRFQLVTMGSPLRQLYAQNFPHLYRWIDASDDGNADDDATARSPEADVSAAAGGELTGRSPSPLWLGVAQWVNLFTTGDYIGRTLWRREAPATWKRQEFHEASTADQRRERCLGAGTHTRYWTSPDVARELDAVIAAETPPSPPCLE